jgi:hypothetical protein
MIEIDFDLVGAYFVQPGGNVSPEEGWVRRNLGSGFYLAEVFIEAGEGAETVLRIMHFVEMRNATFYRNREQAQRHYDKLVLESLPAIDLEPIRDAVAQELVDLVLEQLARAQSAQRKQELAELLNHLLGKKL